MLTVKSPRLVSRLSVSSRTITPYAPYLAIVAVFVLTLFAAQITIAQTYRTLHNFGGNSGAFPNAAMVMDSKGNLYGATQGGGKKGNGTVFMLSATKLTLLYTFKGGQDGATPSLGTLVMDSNGNIYGTTLNGGGSGCEEGGPPGCGTVFKISGKKETVLHAFGTTNYDGLLPEAGLLMDAKGSLYGTTASGGAYGSGTVFEIDNTGSESVLYSFCAKVGCTDGAEPYGGMASDANGNLYGTTWGGGATDCNGGCGTVFKLSKSGKETVLYSFCSLPGCVDGSSPIGNLIMDTSGNLYGVTSSGGTGTCISEAGCGTVFEVDTSGNEIILHNFCSEPDCTDGLFPWAGLLIDSAGNLYGTTSFGGTGKCPDSNGGCGTIFEITGTAETVLYSLTGTPEGEFAYSALNMDGQGNLYGTTSGGGKKGFGAAFKIAP
jgi:uncharacterized repeat protein (TIGR03803 family)